MKVLKTLSLVMFWTIGYRILGFLRELLIANEFGASFQTDAYFIAQSLPSLTIEIFAIGALASAVIPIFLEIKNEKEKFRSESNILIGNFFIISIVLLVFLLIFNKDIINLIVPKFSKDTMTLTYHLSRISILVIPILIITEIYNVLLNCYGEADKISFSHFIYNFSFLIISLALNKYYGIYGFIYGIIFSAILRMIYIYWNLKNYIGSINLKIDFKNKNFLKILKLLIPIIIGTISIQINFIVDRIIGSGLEKGSISYLTYSDKLIQLPLGIILGGVVLTTFPLLVEYIEKGKSEKYQNFIKNKIELIFLIMGIISSFIFCFPEWILSILFQRGEFTLEKVIKTSEILKYYSFSVISISFITLFQKIFYSFKVTKIPTYINIFSVIINIILNITLSKKYGIKGIALATMIANIINAEILFLLLKKKYNVFNLKNKNILKLISLNIFMITLGILSKKYLLNYLNMNFSFKLLIFLSIGLIFLIIYMLGIIIFYPYRELLKGEEK